MFLKAAIPPPLAVHERRMQQQQPEEKSPKSLTLCGLQSINGAIIHHMIVISPLNTLYVFGLSHNKLFSDVGPRTSSLSMAGQAAFKKQLVLRLLFHAHLCFTSTQQMEACVSRLYEQLHLKRHAFIHKASGSTGSKGRITG